MSITAKSNQQSCDSSESVPPHAIDVNAVTVEVAIKMLEQCNLVKVDPAKLRFILDSCKSELSVGCGKASGENRAELATDTALAAVSSSSGGCYDNTLALVSICGSQDMSMNEYNVIVKTVLGKMQDDISFLIGVRTEDSWSDCIQVTVLVDRGGNSHN